jgi:hypothetical protein
VGVKPRSPKGRAQRAGLTHASASNTLPCHCETLHSKLLRSIKNPIDSDHGIYGDFAAGSVVRVEERSGSEAHLASWDGHDGEREGAAGVLHDEILRVLVLMTRQSDAATRALTPSAENQHRQRTSLGLSCHNAGIMRCRS